MSLDPGSRVARCGHRRPMPGAGTAPGSPPRSTSREGECGSRPGRPSTRGQKSLPLNTRRAILLLATRWAAAHRAHACGRWFAASQILNATHRGHRPAAQGRGASPVGRARPPRLVARGYRTLEERFSGQDIPHLQRRIHQMTTSTRANDRGNEFVSPPQRVGEQVSLAVGGGAVILQMGDGGNL